MIYINSIFESIHFGEHSHACVRTSALLCPAEHIFSNCILCDLVQIIGLDIH